MSEEKSKVIGAIGPGGDITHAVKILNAHAAKEQGGLLSILPAPIREVLGNSGPVASAATDGHSAAMPWERRGQSQSLEEKMKTVEQRRQRHSEAQDKPIPFPPGDDPGAA